jgi:hypothetical protein
MQGETNIFLRGLRAAPAPWQHKSVNLGLPNRRDEIVDYEGRNIIDFALPGGGYTIEEYRNTLALVANAPNLLAALVELVYNQRELLGAVPEPALLELIKNCGGPDLTQHKTIHEQTTVVEPEAQPPAANERLLG